MKYNWINKAVSFIGVDKVLHFSIGMNIYLIFGSWWLLFLAATLKEVYDHYTYGHFDLIDLSATLLGGVVGFLLMIII
jgi:hypothetical protein